MRETTILHKNKDLSTELLSTILSNGLQMTVLTDKNGIVNYVSPQCLNVLGYSADTFLGVTFPDIIHEDDVERCRQAWSDVFYNQSPLTNYQYRIYDPENKIRWISHSACTIMEDGKEIGMQSSIINITEWKELEEKYKESSKINEAILSSSPDMIYIYDIKNKKDVYVNRDKHIFLDYDRSEIQAMGEDFLQRLMHPDDYTHYINHSLNKYDNLKEGEILDHIYRMKNKSGVWIWHHSKEVVFKRDEQGKVLQVFGSVRNITEQKNKEKEQRLLFENMSNAFALHEIIVDDSGRPVDYVYKEVNQAFEKMTGTSKKDLIGKKVTEVFPGTENDPADWIGKYGAVALEEKTLDMEQYSEALKRWFHIVAYSPQPKYFVTLFMDISSQKDLQEKLFQSEKMSAIGQLAGGVAHDFNNQLAGILGYADMLKMDLEDNPDAQDMLDNIILASQRASDLTAQLLAFARKGKFKLSSVDVHQILREVENILKHTIDKKIRISMDLKAENSIIQGDATQVQNAIMNITLNAKDAMPEGGELSIHTQNKNISKEDLTDNRFELKAGKCIEISISDTGSGMDAETLGHIFEPFYTTKSKGKGTGMGMSAVFGTLQNHKGSINITSDPCIGTTMTLLLPLEGDKVQEENTMQLINEQIHSHLNIMIIEDEPLILNSAKHFLEKKGFTVTGKTDGSSALDFFKTKYTEIDLVIMDIIMPGISGGKLYKRLKAIDPHIKVLLCSGYSIDSESQELMKMGALDFIQKPYRMQDLWNIIQTLPLSK